MVTVAQTVPSSAQRVPPSLNGVQELVPFDLPAVVRFVLPKPVKSTTIALAVTDPALPTLKALCYDVRQGRQADDRVVNANGAQLVDVELQWTFVLERGTHLREVSATRRRS